MIKIDKRNYKGYSESTNPRALSFMLFKWYLIHLNFHGYLKISVLLIRLYNVVLLINYLCLLFMKCINWIKFSDESCNRPTASSGNENVGGNCFSQVLSFFSLSFWFWFLVLHPFDLSTFPRICSPFLVFLRAVIYGFLLSRLCARDVNVLEYFFLGIIGMLFCYMVSLCYHLLYAIFKKAEQGLCFCLRKLSLK